MSAGAKVTQFVKRWRSELAGAAGVATAAVSAGVLNGSALRIATGVIAVAVFAGVYRKKS